ncbi:MAG TPA: response regulator [Candidatus Limnocylindrales bacterium]|nr:response regulator [Candidatus Limnocylindrales bacterium]
MPAESSVSRRPVLLVDDDDVFVDLVERHLVAHGYAVLTAGSVDAARRLLAGGTRPELLILDINLPDDSGWSLLRDGSLAAAGSPPVVIMSGTQIRPERLREYHVAGYLPKPVSMALLTSCINRFTNRPGSSAPADSSEVLG